MWAPVPCHHVPGTTMVHATRYTLLLCYTSYHRDQQLLKYQTIKFINILYITMTKSMSSNITDWTLPSETMRSFDPSNSECCLSLLKTSFDARRVLRGSFVQPEDTTTTVTAPLWWWCVSPLLVLYQLASSNVVSQHRAAASKYDHFQQVSTH